MVGHNNFKVIDIAYIAVFTSIIFALEQLLSFIPNVQLTVFLLILYAKKLGFIRCSIIVVLHVILDNLYMNSFNLIFTPTMLIGWMFIPIIICLFFKRCENSIILAFVGALCAFLYSWSYIPVMAIAYKMDPLAYFLSDIVFELILAGSSFISVLILYKPLSICFNHFYKSF